MLPIEEEVAACPRAYEYDTTPGIEEIAEGIGAAMKEKIEILLERLANGFADVECLQPVLVSIR